MASIVVRGLEDQVKEALAHRARLNGRSMEAEVRAILTAQAGGRNVGLALMEATRSLGGIELEVPERSDVARAADFG